MTPKRATIRVEVEVWGSERTISGISTDRMAQYIRVSALNAIRDSGDFLVGDIKARVDIG